MRSIALGLALLSLPSCAPAPDPEMFLEEDFETLCDGVPCGWVRSGGPEDGARWIETIPGDHGLLLEGDGVFVRGPAAPPLATTTLVDVVAVRATARCDSTSSITVRVSIEEGVGAEPEFVTFERELLPEAAWREAPMDQTMDPTDGAPRTWALRRVLGISLLKNGPGTCEIDYVGIRAVNTPFI